MPGVRSGMGAALSRTACEPLGSPAGPFSNTRRPVLGTAHGPGRQRLVNGTAANRVVSLAARTRLRGQTRPRILSLLNIQRSHGDLPMDHDTLLAFLAAWTATMTLLRQWSRRRR